MTSEISQTHRRTNIVWLYVHEIFRIGRFIETESRLEMTRAWEKGVMRMSFRCWKSFGDCNDGCIMCVLVTQSCLPLSDPMNCSLWGFSVHGILQARILEWIAIPFFRGSFRPRVRTLVSCIGGKFFTVWATGKSNNTVNQINTDDLYK